MHLGVYATFTGPPCREAWLWAAVLRAGPDAVLSHQTAAELDRLTDKPSALIHVMVPAEQHVTKIPGVCVHLRASSLTCTRPSASAAMTASAAGSPLPSARRAVLPHGSVRAPVCQCYFHLSVRTDI
jgi:hypothetical protein